jgi:hypothetical protein
MVDRIMFGDNAVPFFDHDRIHLIHAFKGAVEILNRVLIVEVGI